MKTLIIVGTSPDVASDLAKLKGADKTADKCGIGKAPLRRKCKYWYTAHTKLFSLSCKGDPIKKSVAGTNPNVRVGIVPKPYVFGSSSLHAVYLALNKWGYDRIILCGVPIEGDNDGLRYDRFIHAWEAVEADIKGKVFSVSGKTKTLLGGPYATRG